MPPPVAVTELGPTVIGVMWMETIVTLILIIMRLYCRAYLMTGRVGWDDWLMAASWVFLVGYTSTCTAATRWGFGRHMGELSFEQFAVANLLEICGQTCYLVAMVLSKGSVAAFLVRITPVLWHRVTLWVIMAGFTIIAFLCALLNWLQCFPTAFVWDKTVKGGHCWMSITPVALTAGGVSCFVDFAFAAFPWQIVYKLNMPKREKLNIALALSLGVFAGICGIIRTYELQGLSAVDYSYDTVPLVLWAASELAITIICANIPLLQPLIRKVRGQSTLHSDHSPASYPSQPTIGGGRKKSGSNGKMFGSDSVTELQDTGALRSDLGAERGRGNTKTSVGHSMPRSGSDESILREAREGHIYVREDVSVSRK
ncbi:uncharacterized protein LTR77_005178 [Saxophila tyrrhenica]|uniref:Rhodopsin domain-containing protein n=1 Tax=Saxophila tyrrhenica TaxID=1690608 RepID=A0AAV9PBH3_9PEZI|nr:hypothetical protein LTR77_005178 [Saxophila tyrrhenica]